ncbi:type II toxin-antitoxin system VapC family toxin [Paractinoplanes lichenicola]|uniref:Ribonuclease VapC n=1 Tax=Paractinoplanes lichenicola TaxID=2802976 RepID=A0ABS1VSA9_9ACTN|nr:type II toxin-antitoxin system VapC family toxin [Actinoplanes lichenicola]MBL7256737.1 type II toxin-antitoxin system VapC family toxin [Actinoplanes lichenicola]
MIYLDSAAVVKLVRQEAHSADLVAWLNAHEDVPLISSALIEVEVPRAVRRSAPQSLIGVPAAVGRVYRLEIDSTVRATAATFSEPMLRSLDAIHLATAQVVTNEAGAPLTAFVTYDRRLLDCAKAVGLPVASPGQD